MKNITKQYQDLLEGKMSKDNFMRNVRRDFPQWISPVNSFGDAVNILKSKRILTETSAGGFHKGAPMSGPAGVRIGGEPRKDENIFNTAQMGGILDNPQSGKKSSLERMIDDLKAKYPGVDLKPFLSKYNIHQKNSTAPEVYLPAFDDYMDNEMLTQMQNKRAGEFDPNNPGKNSVLEKDGSRMDLSPEATRKMIDKLNKQRPEKEVEPDEKDEEDPTFDDRKKGLREVAEKPAGAYKNVTGKAEYDKFAEMDRVDYRQLMKGTEFELLKMPEITDENLVKAKTKAYKALIKNPKAYMHLVTSNANEVEKKDKDLRMQPVKGDNKVDKANAMKVIKKDEGSNTQTNLSNKEKAKGNPKGVKEMPDKGVVGVEKVLRESLVRQLREHILDEMVEVGSQQTTHNKGEAVRRKGSDKVGTVREVTSDNTCEVVYEDGSVEEIQGNVLEKYTGATQMDEYEVGDETPSNTSFNFSSSEKRGQDINAAAAAETHDGIKRNDIVKVDAPGFKEDEEYKVTNFRTIPSGKSRILQSIDVTVKGRDGVEKVVNIKSVKKVGEDKNAALKEKLVKSLKKEMKAVIVPTTATPQQVDALTKRAMPTAKPGESIEVVRK